MRTAEGKECTYLLSTTWLESTSGGSQSTSLVFRAHWFCFSKFGITFNSLVILERSGNWKSFSGQCWWWWCYIYAPFNTQEPTSCPIFVEHLHIHFHLLPSFRMTSEKVSEWQQQVCWGQSWWWSATGRWERQRLSNNSSTLAQLSQKITAWPWVGRWVRPPCQCWQSAVQVGSKLVHIPDTSDAVELLILDCSGREVTLDSLDGNIFCTFPIKNVISFHNIRFILS